MQKEMIKKKYRSFIEEIERDLHGKKQGYVKIIEIGGNIFPYSIPPHLEIILLDPDDQTIVYRRATDPDSFKRKKGQWITGKPFDAVCSVIDWTAEMKVSRQHYRMKTLPPEAGSLHP